jgi:hypothetical protein
LLEKIRDERSHNISRQDDPAELLQVPLESIEKKIDALNECLQKQFSLFKDLDVIPYPPSFVFLIFFPGKIF